MSNTIKLCILNDAIVFYSQLKWLI